MSSFFVGAEGQKFINRINKLTENSQPLWGKMNSSQMLYHCQQPMRIAFGEIKLKQSLIGFLFGKMAKKKLMSEAPMPKNLPTAKSFIAQGNLHFEEEKMKLTALVQQLSESGAGSITKDSHPFFGRLTSQEWDTLMSKHLDHHLRQFGV